MSKLEKQIRWDRHHLSRCEKNAEMSKDPSTKVGAEIVTEDNRPVSSGFNGFPKGTDDSPEIYADRERKYLRIIHAEDNAFLFAKQQGHTLYCTHPPCAQCMGKAIQHGIKRVVWYKVEMRESWRRSHEEAVQMALEAGITLLAYDV